VPKSKAKAKPKKKIRAYVAVDAVIVGGGLRIIDLDRPLRTQDEIVAWYESQG
jgi:hypothetical protein